MGRFGSAIIRIIICVITLAILTGILIFGLTFAAKGGFNNWNIFNNIPFVSSYNYNGHNTENYEVGDGSVSAQNIRNIDIDWVSGDVTVLPTDESVITLTETSKSDISDENAKMRWTVDGDTLRIAFCKSQIIITNFANIHKSLTLYVPGELLSSLKSFDANVISAELEGSYIGCDELDVEAVSGKITLTDCECDKLKLDNVSGHIKYSGKARDIDCESVSGGAVITLSENPEKIDYSNVSGDLDLYLPADASFTVESDSVSGDLDCDFAISLKDKKYVCGDGKTRIDFDSVSGDIFIGITE